MKSFENISEPEINAESKDVSNVREKITSLVSDLREKYPQFIRTLETPKTIARVLVMFAMLQGGELLAKDAFTEDVKKNPFSSSEMMDKVPNMSVAEIADSLGPLKLTLPPEKKISFSHTLESPVRGHGPRTNEYDGLIPTDTGTVGDIGVSVSEFLIERSNEKLSKDSSGVNQTDTVEDHLSDKVEVSKDFVAGEIKEIKDGADTVQVSGRGYSNKQEAVMNAIEELSNFTGVYVCTGGVMKNEGERANGTEDIKRHLTTFTAMNGINFFKNLHIDKIEETKEGGEVVYVAYVSAERGELRTLEK